MPNVNKVILMGHIGKDAEVAHTSSGKMVMKFNMATTEKWGEKEDQKHTEWHKIEHWSKFAEDIAKRAVKGALVYVEGKIRTDTVEKEGKKTYYVKINASYVSVIGKFQKSDEEVNEDNTPF